MNTTALLYAVGTLITWGVWGIFTDQSLSAKRPTSVLAVTFLIALVVTLLIDADVTTHFARPGLLPAVGAGLTLAIGSLFFYRALLHGKVAIVPAIGGLFFLVSTAYGILVLEEQVSTANLLGIALACVAIILLTR